MAKQRENRHSKTAVRSRRAVRSHQASNKGHRRMPVGRRGQKTDAVLPEAIEFLEVDVVGPFEAGLEIEESGLVSGDVDEF